MTTTQLWATAPYSTTKQKLDTYPTEPIKLTFTAETLTDLPAINSVFSQTFRLPATGPNDQFFKYWFNVNSNDFDVSKKVQAEIVTESGLFVEGQIRLQKVYRNYESTLIDYEVLFLGEVRDFATQVGEGFMNSIDCSSLNHLLNYANITTSWNALPGTTNGLLDGNVLYPLVEYGYEYDSNGVCLNSQIHTTGSNRFTQNSHPLNQGQFRPWIRAKYLIDSMFAATDYTYTSVFLESDLFNQLYVNASGNTATADFRDLSVNNSVQTSTGDQTHGTVNNIVQIWNWPSEIIDAGNNWSTNTFTASIPGNYNFNYNLIGDVTWVNIGGGSGPWPDVEIEIYYYLNGTPVFIGSANNGAVDPAIFFSETGVLALTLAAGDTVQFGYKVRHFNSPPTLLFETTLYANILDITTTITTINPGNYLSDKIKKLDWFKGILTKFRLVMVPDRENPRNFIIEPWNDYIASGDTYDWTHKLDGAKDIQFEPLFFTQSSSIKFTDQEDTDHPNSNQQLVFKEVYGTRIYDSLNDLLKDQREITTPIAPTPVERVEGMTTGNFIIPHMGALESSEGQASVGFIKPMIAKPRLLFYNGLKASGITWFMQDDFGTAQPHTNFPQLTYLSQFPATPSTLNLSWEIEAGRWLLTPGPDGTSGEDVYVRYWQDYIESVYSPEARKMTATFVLDAQDLKINFNDSIFIRDSWWRILKISDAPLNGINPVKVELIKLLDAPDADCDCTRYFVTDNRIMPEGLFYFDYIDCTTGELTTGSVFENSVQVCACKPFATGDSRVLVTNTGTACKTGPITEIPIGLTSFKSVEGTGAITVGQSETGASGGDWIDAGGLDLPNEPGTFETTSSIDANNFLRTGYFTTGDATHSATINYYRNDELIWAESFIALKDTPTYVVCPERIIDGSTYRTELIIE